MKKLILFISVFLTACASNSYVNQPAAYLVSYTCLIGKKCVESSSETDTTFTYQLKKLENNIYEIQGFAEWNDKEFWGGSESKQLDFKIVFMNKDVAVHEQELRAVGYAAIKEKMRFKKRFNIQKPVTSSVIAEHHLSVY